LKFIPPLAFNPVLSNGVSLSLCDRRGGKTKLLGFFVGMVLKESGSRADPVLAQTITEEVLNNGQ
jgi:Asp-tRNA(Asn)/Glu-tRNA(Gln) amidotransferase B subunit